MEAKYGSLSVSPSIPTKQGKNKGKKEKVEQGKQDERKTMSFSMTVITFLFLSRINVT